VLYPPFVSVTGRAAALTAFKEHPLALCYALEATIRNLSFNSGTTGSMQDTRLIISVMAACQSAAAAGELAAAVAEDSSKRLGPRLLALAVSILKCGNGMLSYTAAAAAGKGVDGSVNSVHSSSARCLAVFHLGSVAAAMAKGLLMHGHDQQQQENAPAAANVNSRSSSNSSQQSVEHGNWLMLIGRGCMAAGHALEQCCAPAAAAAAITSSASATVFGEAADAAAAAQLNNTEWISDSEHPLRAMQRMSAVIAWLELQLPLLLPSYAVAMQQQLLQQQGQLLASLQQLTAALQAARLDDVLASSADAELNIAAVMQAMHAVNIQGQGGQLLQLSQQLSSFGTALCAAVPVRCCCNNPGCSELGEASELELVSGKSSRCSGCKLARYHSAECLKAHWKQHKLVCRAIAAQQ
jgi:hypothetical protein